MEELFCYLGLYANRILLYEIDDIAIPTNNPFLYTHTFFSWDFPFNSDTLYQLILPKNISFSFLPFTAPTAALLGYHVLLATTILKVCFIWNIYDTQQTCVKMFLVITKKAEQIGEYKSWYHKRFEFRIVSIISCQNNNWFYFTILHYYDDFMHQISC